MRSIRLYRYRRFFSAALLLTMGIFVGFLLFSRFTITTIEIQGDAVQVFLDKEKITTNLMFFPTEQLRSALITEYPQLLDIQFRKKYPSTLIVTVFARKPIARVITADGRTLGIDQTGRILTDTTDSSIPVIYLPWNFRKDSAIVNDIPVSILPFLSEIGQRLPIKTITYEDSSTLTVVVDTTQVRLRPDYDGREAARALQSLLQGFRIKGSLPRSVDLRFAKPVVTF